MARKKTISRSEVMRAYVGTEGGFFKKNLIINK
jgi:hypothetical protein